MTGAPLDVVIVNHRTPEQVERCIASLREAAVYVPMDVVVVDNGSSDGSAARLGALPGIRLLALEDNRGFAAGVNAGMAAGGAPFALWLNPDTVVERGAPVALRQRLEADPGLAVVAPLVTGENGSAELSAYRRFPNLATLFTDMCLPVGTALHGTSLHPHNVSRARLARGGAVAHVGGGALAIRRSAYEAAGLLDEGFFLYLEETEWQERLARAGWRIEVLPSARVTHGTRGGGHAAQVPSPHYLPSAYRYLEARGVSEQAITRTLTAALGVTLVSFEAAALWPPLRAKARRSQAGYRPLWDYVRRRSRDSSARS